jgi:REP element-mobilizing transposase RayT
MPRRRVEIRVGECYHIYNRGANRQAIFFEPDSYSHFIRKLRQFVTHPTETHASRDAAATVLAYCLMPNHYHLLVRVLSSEFSEAMRSFGQAHTQAINRRFDRSGTLFEGRFQAIHVDRDAYLMHLSRYIHLNPVEAGLVELPEGWEYSSYRDYVGLREGTLPEIEPILREFASRAAYARFVESGMAREDELIRHLVID